MTSNTDDNPLIILAIYLFLGFFVASSEYYNKKEYLFAIINFIVGLLIWISFITLIWYIWTDSRSCPKDFKLYIMQRDINDFITAEYTIYRNKAPVLNNEDPDYPPAVRVNTPITSLNDIIFPTFSFNKPTFASTYRDENFEPLEFRRIDSMSSLFFPSYSVFKKENPDIELAQILYPILSEEADFWSLTKLQLRYVIKYNEKRYVSNRQFQILEIIKGNFVETFKLYDYDNGSEDDPIAIIKVRKNAFDVNGRYTVCIRSSDPILKELIFATMIAFDQHIRVEESNKK